MSSAGFILLWVSSLTTLTGWPEPSPVPAAGPAPSARSLTSSSSLRRDRRGPITEHGSLVTSKDSAQLDDEVEIPEEQDNDDSDDHGEALSREGRSNSLSADVSTPTLSSPSDPSSLRPLASVPACPERSLFLRFCRLLI